MGKIYHSVEELIGHTPLLEMENYAKNRELKARILVKLESFNPLGSMKDRVANAMIDDLEKRGRIHKGDYIVEVSSGNTGIALAAIGTKRGYRVRIYLGGVSEERFKLIETLGGECVDIGKSAEFGLAFQKTGSCMDAVAELLKEEEKRTGVHFELTAQGNNAANPAVHYHTTGPEIWEDAGGKVDVLVDGIGSGGSIRGLSDYFKERNPEFKVIAFDPTTESAEAIQGVHKFTVLPENDYPKNLSTHPFDEIVEINKKQAYQTVKDIAREEGLVLGITTGAAVHIATELAKKPEYEGKTILTLAVDDGIKYLSTDLFDREVEV